MNILLHTLVLSTGIKANGWSKGDRLFVLEVLLKIWRVLLMFRANLSVSICGCKIFISRESIWIRMDKLTLDGDIVGISIVSRSPILVGEMSVEQHISEKNHISDALRF